METKWLLSKFRGDRLITPSIVTLNLEKDGVVTGFSGCNSYKGRYDIDGEKLAISKMQTTDSECLQQVVEIEEDFLELLMTSAAYTVRGEKLELINEGGDHTLEFDPYEYIDLRGTNWQVLEFAGGMDAMVPVLDGTVITVDFGDEGLLSGSAGCNGYSASYDVTNGHINVEALVMTEMYCMEPDSIMEQETQFLTALGKSTFYLITIDSLVLLDEEGALLVSLTSTMQ